MVDSINTEKTLPPSQIADKPDISCCESQVEAKSYFD